MAETHTLVEDVRRIFEAGGSSGYIGEPVSQLAHALQAGGCAQAAGADSEVVLAAWLHDIGHLACSDGPSMDGLGVVDHEKKGAEYLRKGGVSARLAHLVAGHVKAKRFLVATQPEYAEKLSEASKGTLKWQGGAMSEEEVAAFRSDADMQTILAMRRWDEAAKVPNAETPSLESFLALLQEHLDHQNLFSISEEQRREWQREHRLQLSPGLQASHLRDLVAAVDDLASRPETAGKWMKYFEAGDMLCRVEDFLPYHAGLRSLLTGSGLLGALQTLVGEEMVLFKEKINFKLPGGSGFGAHQDAPAFARFCDYNVTVMVAVDDADVANGCLEFAPGVPEGETLAQKADGTIAGEEEERLTWTAAPAKAGDVLFFDSYIPHRSHANTSDRPRRVLYVTYNRARDGSFRAGYFADKRKAFPPRCERVEGVDYSATAGPYNLGNPIK